MTLEKKPTLLQVVMSVLAAIFGVQSDQARQRDFTAGNPTIFIVMAIVIVILLVLLIYVGVRWIVSVSQVV